MQFVGLKNNISKAVIIVHLEEIEEGDNPELAKVGFSNNTLGNWGVGQSQTFTYSSFDPNKFIRSDEYVLYVGTSTNENCDRALIIQTQNSEFISKAQLLNLGGSEMEPIFQPKDLTNNLTIMQNFASLANDMWDPLKKVLQANDFLPASFPVPIQFSKFMYNPLDQKYLGDIPENAIPFWKPLPPDAQITNPGAPPRVAFGYKAMPYYHIINPDSQKLEPRYIVVPNSYVPNPGARPNKIPIAIRSKMAYPNLSRGVVNLEMVVNWTPEPIILPPPPPKAPVLPPINPNYTITPLRNSTASPTSPSTPSAPGGTSSNPSNPASPGSPGSTSGSTDPQLDPSSAEFNISKICTKIRFEVILNVRRSQWDFIQNLPENLRATIHKCEQFQFDPFGLFSGNRPKTAIEEQEEEEQKKEEEEKSKGKPPAPGSGSGSKGNSNTETVKVTNIVDNSTEANRDLIKRFCQNHELHVVLNREQAPHVQDYVKHFCRDKVIENRNMKDQVMLAQLKSEMAKFLARKVIAQQAMSLKKDQVDFDSKLLEGTTQASL
jgi:hypothetical protein